MTLIRVEIGQYLDYRTVTAVVFAGVADKPADTRFS
jgi:hypothetical protein